MHGLVVFRCDKPKASAVRRGAVSVEVRPADQNGKYRRRGWLGRRYGIDSHVQPRGKFPLAFVVGSTKWLVMTLRVHGSVRQLTFSLRHNGCDVPTWSYHEVGTTLNMSARGLICSYEVGL
jgi:hypothetical protein